MSQKRSELAAANQKLAELSKVVAEEILRFLQKNRLEVYADEEIFEHIKKSSLSDELYCNLSKLSMDKESAIESMAIKALLDLKEGGKIVREYLGAQGYWGIK